MPSCALRNKILILYINLLIEAESPVLTSLVSITPASLLVLPSKSSFLNSLFSFSRVVYHSNTLYHLLIISLLPPRKEGHFSCCCYSVTQPQYLGQGWHITNDKYLWNIWMNENAFQWTGLRTWFQQSLEAHLTMMAKQGKQWRKRRPTSASCGAPSCGWVPMGSLWDQHGHFIMWMGWRVL